MTATGIRRLILTRHAKSAWDDPSMDDHDRPLNDRGRRSARALGDWLASRGYDPEEVLCSTSRRTVETWERAAAAVFETRPPLQLRPELYHAEPDEMMDVLRIGQEKIRDKGIRSAKKRVDPLRRQTGLSRAEIWDVMIQTFTERTGAKLAELSAEDIARAEDLARTKFSTPEWTHRVR